MSEYEMFEREVLAKSKRLRFSSDAPFIGLSTPDRQLNKDYFKLLFNSIMHKIISYKHTDFLSYQEYEIAFAQHIVKKREGTQLLFFYDHKLVLKVDTHYEKQFKGSLIYPCDNEIIKEDTLFMTEYKRKDV
ncbi:hypothetical protein J8L70_13705 [Pseudoalteromonas sp. MMG010]|uniref:hypothetical protein n=1 Tax=Pseudoalteromonas sp. MMG010 TaxID=2822685 RepID=UPI001B39ED1C|nr:hypothetical protein [Pseudoalteromonas sp. MMG010]MBQ4834303.1 hypothetical protein [Pseudoalteromonas sp. MMG010]